MTRRGAEVSPSPLAGDSQSCVAEGLAKQGVRGVSKVTLTFAEISERLHIAPLPEVDVVVGIARGGLIPAALVAHQLRVRLAVMRVNYRDDDNKPRAEVPKLLQGHDIELIGKRVLLVDDVSVSGATLRFAAGLLSDAAQITTLTLKGKADIVLFPEVSSCVNWPWSLS